MDETNYLDVRGMHCAACAARIEKTVAKIDGVREISVNLATEKGRVTFNKNRTSIAEITRRINKIGFEAKKINKYSNSTSEKRKDVSVLKWKFILSAVLTFPLAWAMLAHFKWASFVYVPELFTNPFFQFIITIPIQFIIGFAFYERAWKALKNGSATMDVLVVLSTSAAFFYSHFLTIAMVKNPASADSIVLYYDTSAFIITFILLGKFLEAKTKLNTTEAIKKLYQLQAKTATLYFDNKELKSPVERIKPGDTIILKPGEKVPIDGQVIDGFTTIDEALLTGESIPVEKTVGSHVYAGTINQNGVLKINVTKTESETTLSKIIRIVEETQAFKAPIQHIADKITGVFVPIVVLIAFATFTVWYTTFQPGDFGEALDKVIAVLIIACPCALGLATPTSIMVGSGRAAQMGILFKEGKFLEILGKCKTVIMDKTGTLTNGKPEVTNIYVNRLSENAFLKIVGAVEQTSNHPIAKAITQKAKSKVHFLPRVNKAVSMPGYGVKAMVNGQKVIIANPGYYKKNNIFIPPQADSLVYDLTEKGQTVMIVFIDSRLAGIIAVADEIRASSIVAVSRLKQAGLGIIMLTGDNRNTGMTVARKLAIKNYQTEVTPQDKERIIQQLKNQGNKVVMVGDGINDAPALASADVGIAIGTGSDIAIETGDVTIIKGDLKRLIDAITISKKTMTNIKQNFLWAFLYNIIMIPFAMLGLLAPWIAGAAMAFSSLSVVLNSLRLKRVVI
ncbi:heavy metal translocating P-type ATPase [Virgibacillus dakarensis]|nr:heavy metal translocating P-type ATPase [Virgibacillus dakarensis]